ncbi:MAG: hypothetical protein ACI8UO_000890 [Verrucomicrobiales bacterium]|jgi:hypothetical protein
MKTNAVHPLPEAFGITIVDASRVTEFNSEVSFDVELRHDQIRQQLLCGLVSPDYTKGLAIAIDPSTGAVIDALNGAGTLGYLNSAPLLPHRPLTCQLRIQKFGKNHICSVSIKGESIMYPAFLSDKRLSFNAIVGSDVPSGSKTAYRNPSLSMNAIAKVA